MQAVETGFPCMGTLTTNDTAELVAPRKLAYLASFCPSSNGDLLSSAYTGCLAASAALHIKARTSLVHPRPPINHASLRGGNASRRILFFSFWLLSALHSHICVKLMAAASTVSMLDSEQMQADFPKFDGLVLTTLCCASLQTLHNTATTLDQ